MLRRAAAPILAALLLALAAAPAPAQAPEAYGPPAPEAPQRVIIRINRTLEVTGWVEFEDDDVIVVREVDGEMVSHPKSRLLKIVRLVDPEGGQRGRVIHRNGQVSEGVVIEDAFTHVTVEVEGIRIQFKREVIEEVVLEPTFDETYRRFKAALEPNMLERHLALCRWLLEQHRYDLARAELKELLEKRPDYPDAGRLLEIVEAQIALEQGTIGRSSSAAPAGLPGLPEDDSGPVYPADLLPQRLLSHADVNIIRVYEIDVSDPPRLAIPAETIRQLLETHGSSNALPQTAEGRTALFRADPLEILKILFELRARDLYGDVEVLTEPRSLNLFRQRVHNTWLMNSCATSRCHGGPYAGRLFLHRENHKNPRVRLTNLLILERLALDPQWPLVNYERPLDSLIIQYGMPRETAHRPHPEARGWRPVFTQGNQRLLRHTVEWIEAMMRPRPQYPVEYEPPAMGGPPPPKRALDDPAPADGRVPR